MRTAFCSVANLWTDGADARRVSKPSRCRKHLTARERGKVGPVAQSDNDNQGLAIFHTATHGKGIRSRVKLGKRGPKQVGTDADRAAALAIDESTGC